MDHGGQAGWQASAWLHTAASRPAGERGGPSDDCFFAPLIFSSPGHLPSPQHLAAGRSYSSTVLHTPVFVMNVEVPVACFILIFLFALQHYGWNQCQTKHCSPQHQDFGRAPAFRSLMKSRCFQTSLYAVQGTIFVN